MNNRYSLKIIFLIIIFLLFYSCSKDKNPEKLNVNLLKVYHNSILTDEYYYYSNFQLIKSYSYYSAYLKDSSCQNTYPINGDSSAYIYSDGKLKEIHVHYICPEATEYIITYNYLQAKLSSITTNQNDIICLFDKDSVFYTYGASIDFHWGIYCQFDLMGNIISSHYTGGDYSRNKEFIYNNGVNIYKKFGLFHTGYNRFFRHYDGHNKGLFNEELLSGNNLTFYTCSHLERSLYNPKWRNTYLDSIKYDVEININGLPTKIIKDFSRLDVTWSNIERHIDTIKFYYSRVD